MNAKIRYILLSAACASAMCGCASDNAYYVDSGGPRTVVSTDKINIADWNNASAALVNEMLSSGVLERFKQPVKMRVSRIVNRTSQPVDTDLLTKQICIVLNNSGKVVAESSDKAASELAEYEAFKANKQVAAPQITMSGKIIEDRESNSDVREVTYVFMLDINSAGVAVWSGQKQITKQAQKGLFGF